jgi:ATP-binding cassette subfamily B protein
MFIDRMVLLISHRFSTVRLADYIYVLEGGKISESGTHDQLVHRGGKYAQLFEIQARSYR